MLEHGAEAIQIFDPIKKINVHLCGFAFYQDDPKRQLELHHYTSVVNDDFYQCAVYDSDRSDARLIGIEYVCSEKIFNTLSPEEQKLWHSHCFDVKSGSFIAPHIPQTVENKLFEDLIKTYGKTYVLWQVDKDPLPLGEPKLMMVATKEGQWNQALFEERDKRYGSTEKCKKAREVLPDVPTNPNADQFDPNKL